jgi:hypothetical protein
LRPRVRRLPCIWQNSSTTRRDGAWELEQATPSFDAALKALTNGIEKRDTTMLSFLGVYLD